MIKRKINVLIVCICLLIVLIIAIFYFYPENDISLDVLNKKTILKQIIIKIFIVLIL